METLKTTFFFLQKNLVKSAIEKIKNSGNNYYARKNYKIAEKKYLKARRYYDWMIKIKNINDNLNLSSLKISIMLNQAAVNLKTKTYNEALKVCNNVSS